MPTGLQTGLDSATLQTAQGLQPRLISEGSAKGHSPLITTLFMGEYSLEEKYTWQQKETRQIKGENSINKQEIISL